MSRRLIHLRLAHVLLPLLLCSWAAVAAEPTGSNAAALEPAASAPGLLPRKKSSPAAAPRPASPSRSPVCSPVSDYPDNRCMARQPLCEQDLAIGRTAWKYFENNLQPQTGLVNAADNFPSTTMWDLASSLAGTIAAEQLGFITRKQFDDRVTPMLASLLALRLYQDELPNKVYNTVTGELTDYVNKPSKDGVGYSALDMARMLSWLQLLGCMYPKYVPPVRNIVQRWKFHRMVRDGQLYGAAMNASTRKDVSIQEGRRGYEQYAGKMFARLGFDQRISATYRNAFASSVDIYGVQVPIDTRDPRMLGAYNFVVTESYVLDVLEFGLDEENGSLINAIYEVQKRRWQQTGIATAVSEDNIDRSPYFIYNSIYAAGTAWASLTDKGVRHDGLKTISTKAALSLATLFPQDPYSAVLLNAVGSAYSPERGWYSGVYESGLGYNKAITANTNGIILEALLYKAVGPLHEMCARCRRTPEVVAPQVVEASRNFAEYASAAAYAPSLPQPTYVLVAAPDPAPAAAPPAASKPAPAGASPASAAPKPAPAGASPAPAAPKSAPAPGGASPQVAASPSAPAAAPRVVPASAPAPAK
ncbi:DUF3131 domain-containing protein [Hyalangium gracile]|uniref:DUF3131 domain-containing protein n=1 Tax=Hyalangium gracile TaxID=394092 RepID=UPI001CCD67B7|nr:DUF3131 domain-containing protein [Hyalangium gracile]